MTLTAPVPTAARRPSAQSLPRLFAPGIDVLAGHRAAFGAIPDSRGLIEEIAAAGLTGRGGGAFPTATKLAAMGPAAS